MAFRAAVELLKDEGREHVIEETYKKCKASLEEKTGETTNYVKAIYDSFTPEQVSKKIGELLSPKDLKAEVQIIYQTVENLHQACPGNLGDWYFTGDYPTHGGSRVVNRAFVNYFEGNDRRAY